MSSNEPSKAPASQASRKPTQRNRQFHTIPTTSDGEWLWASSSRTASCQIGALTMIVWNCRLRCVGFRDD